MTQKNGTGHHPTPKPPPGMDKFDQLMRGLVKVPKSELDAEVVKDRRERAAKRKAAKRRK